MRRTTYPAGITALLAATFVSAGPAAAALEYAEHVVHCAQEMGMSGTHNPGVHHQGFSGWQAYELITPARGRASPCA